MFLARLEFVLFLVPCIIQTFLRLKACVHLVSELKPTLLTKSIEQSVCIFFRSLTGTEPLCPHPSAIRNSPSRKALYLQNKEPPYCLLRKPLNGLGSLSGKWDLLHCHMLVNTLETASLCNFPSSHQCNLRSLNKYTVNSSLT